MELALGLTEKDRMNMYWEMRKIEPRLWNKLDHCLFAFGSVSSFFGTVYSSAMVYYKVINPPHYALKSRAVYINCSIFLFSASTLFFLRSGEFDKTVYNRHYSHISDDEYTKLFRHICYNEVDIQNETEL